uniref:Uncharacterized protein n=1 Tax=Hucho hucho TaxID=62062 RepID=A0A4W5ML89_9TELE
MEDCSYWGLTIWPTGAFKPDGARCLSYPYPIGYEKIEEAISRTSIADLEDARLIFINQPQLTKFCTNHVR